LGQLDARVVEDGSNTGIEGIMGLIIAKVLEVTAVVSAEVATVTA